MLKQRSVLSSQHRSPTNWELGKELCQISIKCSENKKLDSLEEEFKANLF